MEKFLMKNFETGKEIKEKERQEAINKKREEIDEIADYDGKGIDQKIKNLVVALDLMGLDTKQSCQGHYGEEEGGKGAPWVSIAASEEPEFRFENQKEIIERVAQENGLSFEEVERCDNYDAWLEAEKKITKQEETDEYVEWDKRNKQLWEKTKVLLEEFNEDRELDVEDTRLKVQEIYHGGFRIYNGGEDYAADLMSERSENKKQAHEKRLEKYQKEMDEFANFLLGKYLKGQKQ